VSLRPVSAKGQPGSQATIFWRRPEQTISLGFNITGPNLAKRRYLLAGFSHLI
jgi:hypothetical protein